MRVCVGTIVHHPADARIMHRQIRALLEAGHEVTYIAPFTDCNMAPPQRIQAIDVPRVDVEVATSFSPSRSAIPTTAASAVHRGRS